MSHLDEEFAPATPPSPVALAETKTAEEWAEYRGHVDVGHVAGDFARPPRMRLGGPKAGFNAAADRAVLYRCARAKMGWALGKLVTLAEYDAAVALAQGVTLGNPPGKGG